MRKIADKTLVALGLLVLSASMMAPGAYAQQQNQTGPNKQASHTHSTDWYVDHAYDELARYRTKVVNALTHARKMEDQNCYSTAQGLLSSVGVAANVLRAYEDNPAAYVAKWNRKHPSDPADAHSMAKYIAVQVVGNSSQEGLSVLASAGCK